MHQQIVDLVEAGDEAEAVSLIEQSGASKDVALLFNGLVKELYWSEKHVPALRAVGAAGIDYCLAQRAAAQTAEGADFFGGEAKTIAANLGSYLWPGWDEPGISLTAADIEAGRTAAALNLRLGVELGRPEEKLRDAHWLVGAHCLAANDAGGALSAFTQAGPDERPLVAGYILLARMMAGDAAAAEEFETFLAQTDSYGEQAGTFIYNQLVTARRVFFPA